MKDLVGKRTNLKAIVIRVYFSFQIIEPINMNKTPLAIAREHKLTKDNNQKSAGVHSASYPSEFQELANLLLLLLLFTLLQFQVNNLVKLRF